MTRTISLLVGISMWAICGFGQASSVNSQIVVEGTWSKPVVGKDGYAIRGRLVICEKQISDVRREVAVYVELQDASDFISSGGMQLFCDFGKTDFRPEYTGGLRCEMRDKNQQLVTPTGYPFGGAVPLSEWVRLPTDATIRLRATPFGLHRPGAMTISSEINTLWVIADGDAGEYFLSGTFTVDPAADRTPPGTEHVWRGVIDLPTVKFTNTRK